MLSAEIRPHRAFVAVAILAAALLATLFAAAPDAEAARLTACVKKKTGEMRLVAGKKAKKKCPKGWRKVTWNKKGKRGPSGPRIQVRDADGEFVGRLLGVYPGGGSIFFVQRGGGYYVYFGSGELYPNGPVNYLAPDCSGTAYVSSSSGPAEAARLLKLVGGSVRIVFRTQSAGVFGPSMAWRSAGTSQSVVAQQLYERDDTTGVCQPDGGAFSGVLIALTEVPAPPDFVGPLVLR